MQDADGRVLFYEGTITDITAAHELSQQLSYEASHDALTGLANRRHFRAVLSREIERAGSLPFASPSGFVGVHINNAPARDMLVVAQHQHRQVLDAIERREAGRAEALVREHSRIARHNMQLALREPGGFDMPGVQLIRPN